MSATIMLLLSYLFTNIYETTAGSLALSFYEDKGMPCIQEWTLENSLLPKDLIQGLLG